MTVLPVSNIINVTIEPTPSGLTEKNVNSLALFTTEQPLVLIDTYGIYANTTQVAADYGTNSVTAKMANAIFAQTPNVLSGGGQLVIIPLKAAVSATSGQSLTANISANLATLIAVSSGDLKVTVDGVAYNLTGLNFNACTTLADIASVLQAALANCIVTASATQITFTSKKVGTGSTVALAAYAGGGTSLTGNTLLNTAAATNTAGTNSSGETILQAVARTDGQVAYVPIITNLEMEDAVFAATATAIQAMDHMFLHHFSSTADIAGAITTNQQAGNFKTRPLLYTVSKTAANLMKAAYAGRGFSVQFSGSNTSATMNLKQLATIVPDPGVTQTLYNQANIAGCDLYVSYDGVPSVFSSGGNDFFDNPYSDLALKFALQTAGFNYLRQTNTKVPQTEPGMNGLKAAYADVCERFVRNGCLAPGTWTSSDTFGNPGLFRQNITDHGYYVYSQPLSQQPTPEREARKAPLVQIAAKRAGAIHDGDVIVEVND